MATVTMHDTAAQAETPSQQIVADANRVVRVTDARGRVLGVRKITTSIRRRVYKTISAENGSKESYMGLVILAATCVDIDGQQIPLPTSELQFDALVDRLEDDGFEAIALAHKQNFMKKDDAEAGE